MVATLNNRVEKFNSNGEYISQFGTQGSGNGQFYNPLSIALDSSNNIYVVDAGNDRVQVFSQNGLNQPQQTIDFENINLPLYTSLTNQYAGVNFSGATFFDPTSPNAPPFPNVTGNRISNFIPEQSVRDFSMSFTSNLSAIGFSLISQPGDTTIKALLDGKIVESQIFHTDLTSSGNFLGFQGLKFNQVQISKNSYDRAFQLDNLQFTN